MSIRKITFLSLLIALSMILSYVESALIPYPIPGMKIGLANLVTIFLLYRAGKREAFLVSFLRITLTSLLFGSTVTFAYSLAGFLVSFGGMLLLQKVPSLHVLTVSAVGGLLHNAGQIAAACFLLETGAVRTLLPVLAAIGLGFGLVIGFIGGILIKRIPGGRFAREE